jgi:hypothetical protein
VPLGSVPVAVVHKNDSFVLEESVNHPHQLDRSRLVTIKVSSSSLLPLSTQDGEPFYICLGSIAGLESPVLALSSTNSSLIWVRHDSIFEGTTDNNNCLSVEKTMALLLCKSIVSGVRGTLWVHDSPPLLASMISQLAESHRTVIFMSESTPSIREGVEFIHNRITRRKLESLVPANLQRFVDMSYENMASSIADTLDSLDIGVDIKRLSRDINQTNIVQLEYKTTTMVEFLKNTIQNGLFNTGVPDSKLVAPVPIGAVCDPWRMREYISSIMWDCIEKIPVRINPIPTKNMFSREKTYFLIGLVSEVGMSLIEWMLRNGAKYFAVGSRNPKPNMETINYLTKKGADIRVFALDIAVRSALQDVHREIVASMPPIGGMVNAAMVLRDKPFGSMSLDTLETVLRPKVDGSKNLDELFYDTALEFFVLFGSMASVFGNQGQANYGAANLFMASLIARRRSRGAVGSILDIAMLMGIGYVARSGDTGSTIEAQLQRFSLMAISETDFHHMFAEAVWTGLPESGMNPELLNGLVTNNNTPWRHIPRFSHFTHELHSSATDMSAKKPKHSISKQLEAASNSQERSAILESSICLKLGLILRIPCENINIDKPLNALGIDSLVAVEMRSWLLKEFSVDLPIFKLLGGASVIDICIEILARISELPAIEKTDKHMDDEVEDSASQSPSTGLSPNDKTRNSISQGIDADMAESAESSRSSNADQYDPLSNHPLDADAAECELHSPNSSIQIGEMSQAQERLYFLHEFLDDKSTYNVGYIGDFHGKLDVSNLKAALQIVSIHHESLRSFLLHPTINITRLSGSQL